MGQFETNIWAWFETNRWAVDI